MKYSSMANHHLVVVVVFFSCLIYSSYSYQFVLQWVAKPSEGYNQWAGRMRFLINDTIQFKYRGGADSVAVVSKDDYDKCDADNPIVKFDDGDSIFKFDRSGPFYFITANKANCDQGQKLIVVVLAMRTLPSPPSPGGNAHSPTAAPPLGSSPAPSPTSGAASPGPATSSLSPSPSTGATPPGSISPAAGPGGDSSGSPSSATPGSSAPGSGTPADVNSPPARGRSMAAPPCSSCVYLISAASLVVSVGLGAFV